MMSAWSRAPRPSWTFRRLTSKQFLSRSHPARVAAVAIPKDKDVPHTPSGGSASCLGTGAPRSIAHSKYVIWSAAFVRLSASCEALGRTGRSRHPARRFGSKTEQQTVCGTNWGIDHDRKRRYPTCSPMPRSAR